MVVYIIQLSIFLVIFWGVYELFLKKETFFNYNRLYLLLTPVISMLLPFLSFNFLATYAVEAQQFVELPAVFIGDHVVENATEQAAIPVNSSVGFLEKHVWSLAYALGLLISLSLFIRKIFQFKQLHQQGTISYYFNLKLVEVPHSKIACTFFKTIYLGNNLTSTEKEQILKHEQVHAHQYHSLDLLFFEVLKIALWFHPVVYFYQKQITNLHEYIADAEATKNSDKKSYYESLLNVAFGSEQISFINQFFNHSLIKKRIVMLQKSRSAKAAKFKFLILIPLILAMLTYVSCSNTADLMDSKDEKMEVPAPPAPPASPAPPESPELLLPNETENYGVIEVEDIDNLTDEETDRFMSLSKKIMADNKIHKLVIVDKNKKRVIDFDKTPDLNMTEGGVPFAEVETVPIYPGCNETTNEVAKECLKDKITQFVNTNFDTNAVKPFAEKGTNRIYVRFAITKEGNIDNIQARASSPELVKEAKRVVAMLPRMKPGEKDGEPVNVFYTLPILFQVSE